MRIKFILWQDPGFGWLLRYWHCTALAFTMTRSLGVTVLSRSLSASAADEPDSAHGHQRRLGPVPVPGQIGDGGRALAPDYGGVPSLCPASLVAITRGRRVRRTPEEDPTTALDFGCGALARCCSANSTNLARAVMSSATFFASSGQIAFSSTTSCPTASLPSRRHTIIWRMPSPMDATPGAPFNF